jgi:pantoate--beta-alanine ligase
MRIVHTIPEMKELSLAAKSSGKTVGFVPTMGYFHEGHLSLVRIARKRAGFVAVSIFVNPTQFGKGEDYTSYPSDLDRDIKLLEKEGVDAVFTPETGEMYPAGYDTFVEVEKLAALMCGASRPGHFRGVTTVVLKLFNIVKPDFAVFGEKDYQQVAVIKRMVSDLAIDTEIIVGPTVREKDGLAMSSRNIYLAKKEREDAAILRASLLEGRKMVSSGVSDALQIRSAVRRMIETKNTAVVDYVSVVHPESLDELVTIEDEAIIAVAVKFGKARLIDNIRVRKGAMIDA